MANWHFGRMRNWYLNFGPYVGFLLSAHAVANSAAFTTSSTSSTNSIDVKDSFNSTDFGLALGIGVKFPVSNNVKLFIEDDGQAGVSHLFKDGSDGNVQSVRSSINIGFIFAVK
jgi:opacity protein-like surface antigen